MNSSIWVSLIAIAISIAALTLNVIYLLMKFGVIA